MSLLFVGMLPFCAWGIETDSITSDSVPQLRQFRREIAHRSFIPKGQWITGISVSYSQSDQDNYQFLILENLRPS